MKKKTKVLLAILSAAAISAGAFSLAACGSKSKQVYNSTYYAEYQAYVEERKKAKEDYLGYEEWLTLKLFQDANGGSGSDGSDGQNGKDGSSWLTGTTAPSATQGKDGDFYLDTTSFKIYSKSNGTWTELGSIKGSDGVGEDGVGIESVEYKDGKIVIHLTNGETKEVELPSQITHIHAYNDEEVFTLIEATEETDGLGYKVCTDPDCDHLELVIISKRYIITVKDYDGNVVEGATVVINGAKAVTDARGIATVVGYGYKNDYIISVEGKDTDKLYRTGADPRVEIVVVDALDTAYDDDSWSWKPAIKGEGTYRVSVITDVDYGYPIANKTQVLLCNDTDEYKKYKLSLSDSDAQLVNANSDVLIGNSKTNYEVILAPHQQTSVYFWYDEWKIDMSTPAGTTIPYVVFVEELDVPAEGTDEAVPFTAKSGTEISISSTTAADEDGWVYYTWENTNGEVKQINFTLTDVEVEFTAKQYVWTVTDKSPAPVEDGENIDLITQAGEWAPTDNMYITKFKFRVKLKGGATNGSFKINEVIPDYVLGNPHEIDLSSLVDGKVTSEHNQAEDIWFKVTIPAKAKYTIIASNCSGVAIWDHKPDMEDYLDAYAPNYSVDETGAKDVFEFEAGTYYIRATAPYGDTFELIIRAYNAATDKGASINAPIEITDFEENLQNNIYSIAETFTPPTETYYYIEERYYSFVAPKAGTITVSHDKGEDSSYSVYVGSYNSVKEDYSDTYVAREGEVVYVRIVYTTYSGVEDTVSANFAIQFEAKSGNEGGGSGGQEKIQAVEHTITVQATGGIALSGVTVKLTAKVYDESGEAVNQQFTAVTDSNGQVKFTFIPGRYTITLEGYGEDYYYDGASTSAASTERTITLRTDRYTYNLTVKSGNTAIGNTLVELLAGDGTVVGSGTTNASGEVEIKLFYPQSVSTLYCNVKLSDDLKELYGYQYDIKQEIIKTGDADTPQSIEIALAEKVAYSITVLSPEGVAVNGVTVAFKHGNSTLATATTGANGIVTVKLVPGDYSVVCSNVPAGTNAAPVSLAEGTTVTTIKLGVGDKAVSGGTRSDANYLDNSTLVVGINALTNSAEVNYYKFRTTGSGVYKFLITDKSETSFINYLSVGERYGDSEVLIAGGQQQLVKYGVLLGVNKGVNKTYEVTLELPRGMDVVIGYSTGTKAAGQGQLTISEEEVVIPKTLHSGENTVTLTNGTATAVYEVSQSYYGMLKLTWEGDDIVVTVNGEPVESGVEFDADGSEMEIIITSTSSTSVTLTVEEIVPDWAMGY